MPRGQALVPAKPPGDDRQQRAYPDAECHAPQEAEADVELPYVRGHGGQPIAREVQQREDGQHAARPVPVDGDAGDDKRDPHDDLADRRRPGDGDRGSTRPRPSNGVVQDGKRRP